MPKLSEFKPEKQKFKKVNYTPWDNCPPPEDNASEEKNTSLSSIAAIKSKQKSETGSNRVQIGFKQGSETGSNRVQIGFKQGSETGSEVGSNRVQQNAYSEAKKSDKISTVVHGLNSYEDAVYSLTGSQRKVLYFIVEICFSKGSLVTNPINNSTISRILALPIETVKTAIKRLMKKSLIVKCRSKKGINGFCCFEVTEAVRFYVLEMGKNETNSESLFKFKTGSETGSETGSTPPVGSSSIITTTNELPQEIREIDFSPLEEIGFSDSHLLQIYREYQTHPEKKLPLNVLQDSINALAFDLKHNDVAKDFKHNPIIVLTSMLKKGKPYSSKTPDKYLSPQQQAMAAYVAAKEKQQKNEEELTKRFKDAEFNEWKNQLSEAELLALCAENDLGNIGIDERYRADLPEKTRNMFRRTRATQIAKTYFETEVWPKRKEEILKNLTRNS